MMGGLSLFGLLALAIPVLSVALKPLTAYDVKYVDNAEKRHIRMEELAYVKGRASEIGNFDLSQTFPANKVLVQVALGVDKGNANAEVSLTASCISCFTTGTAVVTTDGLQKDDSILGNIIDFIKDPDPEKLIVEALDLAMEVKLDNLGGHFEFNIAFGAAGTYTIPLFKPSSPAGLQSLDDKNKIGLLFSLELTLTVSGAVDFSTGFDLKFPEGASFILNSVTGELVSMNIAGVEVDALPVKFKKGAACISAILRIKFKAALALSVFNKGFDFEAGVFFDPLQYKACVVFNATAPCPLEFTQNFFQEIGAFARAVVDVDPAKLSLGPTAVSTFFTGSLPGSCLSTAVSGPSITPLQITSGAAKQTSRASSPISKSGAATRQPGGIVALALSTDAPAIPSASSNATSVKSIASSTLKAVPAELTTRTMYSTQNVTITSCRSQYIMCPSHLATPVVQAIKVAQYTTVCPITQTSFPATQPPPAITPPAGAVGMNETSGPSKTSPLSKIKPTIVITSPIKMTPVETPMIRTLDTPVELVSTTFAANATSSSVRRRIRL